MLAVPEQVSLLPLREIVHVSHALFQSVCNTTPLSCITPTKSAGTCWPGIRGAVSPARSRRFVSHVVAPSEFTVRTTVMSFTETPTGVRLLVRYEIAQDWQFFPLPESVS